MEACHRFTEGFNTGTCSWMWRLKGAKSHPFFSTQVPKFCSAFMSGSQMTRRSVDQGVIRCLVVSDFLGMRMGMVGSHHLLLVAQQLWLLNKNKTMLYLRRCCQTSVFSLFEKLLAASMRSEEDQTYPSVCLFAESSSLFTFTVCRVTVNVVRVFPLSLLRDELWDMKPEPRLVRISSNLHVCFLSRACSLMPPPPTPLKLFCKSTGDATRRSAMKQTAALWGAFAFVAPRFAC